MVEGLCWVTLIGRTVRCDDLTKLTIALCKAICSAGECAVVNVGYRHAPEFPYPIPVEDSYNAVLWV
jgi:acetyl esterase/lipase